MIMEIQCQTWLAQPTAENLEINMSRQVLTFTFNPGNPAVVKISCQKLIQIYPYINIYPYKYINPYINMYIIYIYIFLSMLYIYICIYIYIINPYMSYHIVRSAHEEASNAAPVVRGCSLPTPLPALPRRTGCHGSIAGCRTGAEGLPGGPVGAGVETFWNRLFKNIGRFRCLRLSKPIPWVILGV